MFNKERAHPSADKGEWDKSKLVSRYTTVGPDSAPHRAMLRAMGLTDEDIAKPLVGVATCWNESAQLVITNDLIYHLSIGAYDQNNIY